jgi:alanyl-tRNA synthetase
VFTGYESFVEDAVILAAVVDGRRQDKVLRGEKATIVLDKSPFYAESGGQVGDTGKISNGEKRICFDVTDTRKTPEGHILHMGTATEELSVKDGVHARVDEKNRRAIMRNHTAAHLLQAALRGVLGEHVHQAGQLVDRERVRFDFSHFEAVTPEQLADVERFVNDAIFDALPVTTREMPLAQARDMGATALFGEKYGDTVRVVEAGDNSAELCGGTHVDNTSKLGLFKILAENSVAAGVRRIEGATGANVLTLLNDYKNIIADSARTLKAANLSDLPPRCATVMAELKSLEKEISVLNGKLAASALDSLLDDAEQVGGVRVIRAVIPDVKPDVLRTMGDKLKDRYADVVAVMASGSAILCVCGGDAVSRGAHAGNIVREVAALTGGKGGGRPDGAMAGCGDAGKLDGALNALPEIVKRLV